MGQCCREKYVQQLIYFCREYLSIEGKKRELFLLLAFWANAIKVKTMTQNLIACVGGQFPSQICKAAQFRVYDFPAFHTDEMRMRIRVVSVVPVLLLAEFEFQYFSKLLDDRDGLIYGGKTCSREVDPDLFIDVLDTGMPSAFSHYPNDGDALGGDPMPRFLESLEYEFRADCCSPHAPRLPLVDRYQSANYYPIRRIFSREKYRPA